MSEQSGNDSEQRADEGAAAAIPEVDLRPSAPLSPSAHRPEEAEEATPVDGDLDDERDELLEDLDDGRDELLEDLDDGRDELLEDLDIDTGPPADDLDDGSAARSPTADDLPLPPPPPGPAGTDVQDLPPAPPPPGAFPSGEVPAMPDLPPAPPPPGGFPSGEVPAMPDLPPPPGPPDSGDVRWQVPNPTPPWPSAPAPDAPPPPGAYTPPAPAPPGPPPPPGPPGPQGYGAPPRGPQPPGAPAYPPGPAPGYPPGPGYPMAGPQPMPQFADPHGIGRAAARMGGGGRRVGKVPALVLASVLEQDDMVEIVVAGRLRGLNGLVALVGSKVVLVNEREWKPDVLVIPVGPFLQVQGWQDDRYATLLLQDGEHQEVLERIPDRLLAIEFAQRARDRVAANAQGG